jgi:predicted Fe-S protein YdhL (DUF1289 family)
MSTNISLVDSMLQPHRVTAFRESRPDCPDGITICLGGLRLETTVFAWGRIAAAIEQAVSDLAPARPIPARKNLNAADVSGIAYQTGESA